MNAVIYLEMLRDRLRSVISQRENVTTFHFMKDEASPYFANNVRASLYNHSLGNVLTMLEQMRTFNVVHMKPH